MRVGISYLLVSSILTLCFHPMASEDVASGPDLTCGIDNTQLSTETIECLCSSSLPEDPTKITIAGVYDTTFFKWSPDVFAATVKLINEGDFWKHAIDPAEHVEYTIEDSKCDPTQATQAYWTARTENGNKAVHGVIGGRCSGASMAIARVAGLEGVAQCSPSSNSADLSNKDEFPYFSRLLAPNDEHGEVGAIAALIRAFGWEKVTVVATDTQFSKDLAKEFSTLWDHGGLQDETGEWHGEVVASQAIHIDNDFEVDEGSVEQVLRAITGDKSHVSSRIILLIAHEEHAFDILAVAAKNNFQPDTVWVGPSSWVGRNNDASKSYSSQLQNIPGYIGVIPYRNRDSYYQRFLTELQTWQRDNGRTVLEELPPFAAETVDAILALTMAISRVGPSQRRNGTAIVQQLRQLEFNGVSGFVQFNSTTGDRRNPQYEILNAYSTNANDGMLWNSVGVAGTKDVELELEGICFADRGCGLPEAPTDSDPEPQEDWDWRDMPPSVFLVTTAIALLLVGISLKYWRSHVSKQKYKEELDAFRDSIVGIRAAQFDHIPNVKKNADVEQALTVPTQMEVGVWCWKETPFCMPDPPDETVWGDPADCWRKYTSDGNNILECAYNTKQKKCTPGPGYSVDMKSLRQTKLETGFKRDVHRFTSMVNEQKGGSNGTPKSLDDAKLRVADPLPDDLSGEPQLVLVEGDVVQISQQRSDGWAFGTKLHHADEGVARQLVVVATGSNGGDTNIFIDSGWFQLDATRVPSADELAALRENVGDTALDPPKHWCDLKDPTITQQQVLKEGDSERDAVVAEFLHSFGGDARILKVERIENLAMWQSYVVKLQTICYRETGKNVDEHVQRMAKARFERSWLWHGCDSAVVDKILQQGFNRSFAGKNANVYGKGVYFARDANYSARHTYAVPFGIDKRQVVMACRVAVGEYCQGKTDALTPDVRDRASQSLYDSTVGLLSNDNMLNPSIYVTYHDAQAYPEVSIDHSCEISCGDGLTTSSTIKVPDYVPFELEWLAWGLLSYGDD